MAEFIGAVQAGVALAAGFSPLFALLGSVATACILATGAGLRRAFAAWGLLVAVWLVGDGMRVIASARNLADGAGSLMPGAPPWANWTGIGLWAVAGLMVGYVLPAWAGGFAGRRVTMGTGWLSAGAVSVGLSLAIASVAGAAL